MRAPRWRVLSLLGAVACAVAFLAGSVAAQKTIYVNSATGNDANSGLSAGQAVRTLANGVRKLSRAGGDRLVLSGSFREPLSLTNINNPTSGTPNPSWTTIESALDAQGNPTGAIDGGVPSSASAFPYDKRGLPWGFGPGKGNYLYLGVWISQCNWIRLRNLKIHGVAGQGIIAVDTSHLDIDGLTVQWTSQAAMALGNTTIGVGEAPSRDLTVQNCRIDQCNLGEWSNRAASQGFSLGSQSLSIVTWDGFRVLNNHLSNSMREGINFSAGARNGMVAGNLVENVRAAGIYADEAQDTFVARNVVRRIGWYDPANGSGLVLASPYFTQKSGVTINEDGSTGILLSNGDLGPLAPRETGRISGIWVFENVVSWTRKNGISIVNRWRTSGRSGWFLDNLHVFNNVVHRSCQNLAGTSAISIDASATHSTIFNNIMLDCAQYGMFVYDSQLFPFFQVNAITNNLFWGNAVNGTLGSAPVLADPRLVNVPATVGAVGNFIPLLGSPAIGAGVHLPFLRPFGGPTDIGAYQSNVPPWQAGL